MADEAKAIPKPLPQITTLTRPFWEAAARKELVSQRCAACNALVWPPRPACAECGSDELRWTPLSGRGTVYSFTVIREVVGRGMRGFEPELPFVVAWIDLDEGLRLCSNVVQCSIEEVAIGMKVDAVFEEVAAGTFLPKFKPRGKA